MAALERQARAPSGFVAASTGPEGGNIKPGEGNQSAQKNADEIDLGDDEDL
jgi:pre-mRNA-splicing factor SYF1